MSSIDNFIGVFDEVVSPEDCQSLIEAFDYQSKIGTTFGRPKDEPFWREDEALSESLSDSFMPHDLRERILNGIWNSYATYADRYSIIKDTMKHYIYTLKLQRTLPTQGYHVWHYESGDRNTLHRLLFYILYLNDVESGGESEFLYQSQRVEPKTGRLVIAPASFTHTHRGNPPLAGEKYILTGWFEH